MERHSPEPAPQVLPAQLPPPASMPMPGLWVDSIPGPDEPAVRIADLPPNTPLPGTAIDSRG